MQLMAHVGQRYNSRLVYNPLYPEINPSDFKKCEWSEFYRDAKEAIPMNVPELQGKEVDIPACLWIAIIQGTKCPAD